MRDRWTVLRTAREGGAPATLRRRAGGLSLTVMRHTAWTLRCEPWCGAGGAAGQLLWSHDPDPDAALLEAEAWVGARLQEALAELA